jgi:adenosine deaminase CECR1
MMFSLAKDKMEKTELWKIIRKMPKGALLHAHADAMVDFGYLFDVLLKTKGMHIFNEEGLHTDELREGAPIKFRFQKVERGKFICYG